MQATDKKVSDEQRGFRKGKSCGMLVEEYFRKGKSCGMLVEEYLGKDKKLYAAFIDLEKAYKVDREALECPEDLWCGRAANGKNKSFYREANACVKADGKLSDNFATGVEVRQGCVMSPWLFNIFMDGCMRKMKAKVGKIAAN